MAIAIKPSDLKYRYPRVVEKRHQPKFQGKPDPAPFDRDDLYEILPMLEEVLNELGRDDAFVLHFLEDLLNLEMPRFLVSREEVFDYLTYCARQCLDSP